MVGSTFATDPNEWPTFSKLHAAKAYPSSCGSSLDPVSQIMSIGCDCNAVERSMPESGAPRWSVGGYVAVTFKDAERNRDPNNFAEMARYLLSGIGASLEHDIGFDMIVEPLKFFFGRTGCHALMNISYHGIGG
jgi:hypothetical protein